MPGSATNAFASVTVSHAQSSHTRCLWGMEDMVEVPSRSCLESMVRGSLVPHLPLPSCSVGQQEGRGHSGTVPGLTLRSQQRQREEDHWVAAKASWDTPPRSAAPSALVTGAAPSHDCPVISKHPHPIHEQGRDPRSSSGTSCGVSCPQILNPSMLDQLFTMPMTPGHRSQ